MEDFWKPFPSFYSKNDQKCRQNFVFRHQAKWTPTATIRKTNTIRNEIYGKAIEREKKGKRRKKAEISISIHPSCFRMKRNVRKRGRVLNAGWWRVGGERGANLRVAVEKPRRPIRIRQLAWRNAAWRLFFPTIRPTEKCLRLSANRRDISTDACGFPRSQQPKTETSNLSKKKRGKKKRKWIIRPSDITKKWRIAPAAWSLSFFLNLISFLFFPAINTTK